VDAAPGARGFAAGAVLGQGGAMLLGSLLINVSPMDAQRFRR
jgi:hypothetical protein